MGKIKRGLNTNEKLKEMLNTVNDIKACLEDVISEPDDGSGKAMSQICIKHNIDYLKFRRLFQTKLFTEIRSNTVIKSSDIELPELDPYEKLFSAVFALRDLNNVEFPVDFKESVDYLLSSEKDFTEKERMVINLRYGFVDEYEGLSTPLTLNEVGSIMNLSKDRIRQIEAKALRKFRHPSRSKILREGLMEIEAKRKIEQIKFDAERKAMEEKVKETIATMKEPDMKENIKDTVDIDNLCDILKEIHISELTLSSRAYNCLARGRIKNLYELVVKSDEELLEIRNVGVHSLDEINNSVDEFLVDYGFTLEQIRESITEENAQKSTKIAEINMKILKEGLYVLELSTRAWNALQRSGINTVYDLLQKSYYDLTGIRHLGKVSLNDVLLKLDVYLHNKFGTNRAELRKSLGMSDDDYPAPKVVASHHDKIINKYRRL